jgi:hypothetical protein
MPTECYAIYRNWMRHASGNFRRLRKTAQSRLIGTVSEPRAVATQVDASFHGNARL